jgi:hypothetical protein
MAQVAQEASIPVPNGAGNVARSYGADVATVTISTGGSTGNDIDLSIAECDDAALAHCVPAGTSGGPTDVETVTFTPKVGKFYVATVTGYKIVAGDGKFALTEAITVGTPEKGKLTLSRPSPKKFSFATAFNATGSKILGDDRFTHGGYAVEGAIDLKDEGGAVILSIPVRVKAPQPQPEPQPTPQP